MRTEAPVSVQLSDYTPYPFAVEQVDLRFDLDPDATRVRCEMRIRRTGAAGEPLVLDDLLGAPAADGIRAAVLEAEVQGRLHPAGLGRTRARQEELRSDLHGWIDPDDADPRLAPLLGFFAELRVRLSREAFLGLRRFEVQAAVYHEGCGYVRHADAFRAGLPGGGRQGRRAVDGSPRRQRRGHPDPGRRHH